ETIYNIEFAVLLPSVLPNLDRFTAVLGPELEGALLEYRPHYDRLAALEERHAQGSTEASEIAELGLTFDDSLRNVLRVLKAHPAAHQALKEQMGPSEGQDALLIQGLSALKEVVVDMFLTSPEEEQAMDRRIQKLTLKCIKHQVTSAALEEKVAAAKKKKDDTINQKREIFFKLQTKLHHEATISEKSLKRMQLEADRQMMAAQKASERRCAVMQQQLEQLCKHYKTLCTENWEKHRAMRQMNHKVEAETESWLQKYDRDMGALQAELDRLNVEYAEELEQRRELEHKLADIEPECALIREKRRVALKLREQEEREACAATTIQALWRSYQLRKTKAMKAMKAQKKGKKGKTGKRGQKDKGRKGKK
ncbi:DRC10 protein, partial [Amia calva]|nr:DRC10 protein [Amia calva]